VQAGANKRHRCKGMTPEQWADRNDHLAIVEYLAETAPADGLVGK
jgi:hypothetical protein